VVELIHLGLNPRFNMCVAFMDNYFSVGGDIPIDSEMSLVTNFVNLKIKSAQSFEGTHRGRMCVHVFIGVSARTCMSICVCTVFLKKGARHHHRVLFMFNVVSVIVSMARSSITCFLRINAGCRRQHDLINRWRLSPFYYKINISQLVPFGQPYNSLNCSVFVCSV
jgi:hypothetical protein